MIAEQLIIRLPIANEKMALQYLIAAHNKLVYHVFNSPHDKVIEAPVESNQPSRFDHTTAPIICEHPRYDNHNLCVVCGVPYESDL